MLNGTYTALVGNAVDDFSLRFTPGGAAVGDVTIAVNSREQIDGEWEDREDPMYVKITLWWEYAENAAETIMKGDRVIAVGEMYLRYWENRDGDRVPSIEMRADEIGPALRWAQAKVTKVGKDSGRDSDRGRDRDDDRGRGDRGNRGDRGRASGGRGGSRDRRTNDRGSGSARRGSSGRDDRDDDRRSSRRDDREDARSRGGSRGRSARDVWDSDQREDDPSSDLPADPDY